jgi:hypothetical protein
VTSFPLPAALPSPSQAQGEVFSMKGRSVNTVLQSASDVQELFAPSGLKGMEWEDEVEAVEFGKKHMLPVTTSVRELLSAEEMIMVGAAMGNCLSTRRGIYKYATRARQKSSSFWIVCWKQAEKEKEGVSKVRASWVTLRARWVTLRARWVTLRASWATLRARWVTLRARWVSLRARWVTLRARWVTLRARWVTLRARWVTLRALWGTLRARWVTLRARWVTLRARWVTLRASWATLRARWVTLRARWVTFRWRRTCGA